MSNKDTSLIFNRPAANIPYFTPAQTPPSGTLLEVPASDATRPKVFTPLRIRGLELQNRIFLSPLCQYSAEDGHLTDWHVAHLGGIVSRGPGLAIVEATAVLEEGRITPEDAGLWKDSQIAPLKRVVDFAHSQGQKIAIQLAHAGRKASTVAPWLHGGVAASEVAGGWPDNVVGPSSEPHDELYPVPKELSKQGIKEVVAAFVSAAKRAIKAGIDIIEIHNAHGYLLHSFLSPVSNKRTDEYGGSFENRTRLTLEIVDALRAVIPDDMPLFLRISATDCLEDLEIPSWRVDETIKLAHILAARGVDFLDVSAAGVSPLRNVNQALVVKTMPGTVEAAYQSPLSHAIKRAVGDSLLVGIVGGITEGKQAERLLEEGRGDAVLVGRHFQRAPGLVWDWADQLGVQVQAANQIRWGFDGRNTKTKKTDEKTKL